MARKSPALCQSGWAPEALRITDYQLLPAFRGRGFGVQLLGQAVQFARKHGREMVAVTCCAPLEICRRAASIRPRTWA